ncbi:MAG: hypothetical protein J6L96_03525 [Clostridia bacterium]|nr:hypothetical protein [Clostridia bacterium]
MKRFVLLFIIISLAWTVSLVSCVNNSLPIPDTEIDETPNISDTSTPPPDTSDVTEIINIVDLTLSGDILTADALEGFYADGTHDYYFPSIKSQYIIVEFSDGTTMNVKEAFEQELITIADLDRFNIGYFVEIKDNGMEVVSITDRTVAEMIPTDSALELFWQDEFCDYYFPSIRSEYVVVELLNGDSYYVKDALENGIITIKDLDKHNIQYTTVKAREPEADECALEGLKIIDESDENTSPYASLFYSDEEYMYFYPNGAYEVELLYTNGYSEPLYSALERGTVTFDEIDASSVEYFKVAHTEFGKCGVREVVDLEELGYMKNEFPGGMSDDTFDPIYEDDRYIYELHTPYEAAVIVVYNDNSTERVKDALKAGRAKMTDLEKSGIQFSTYPKNTGKSVKLTDYGVNIMYPVLSNIYSGGTDNVAVLCEYKTSQPNGDVLLIKFDSYNEFAEFAHLESLAYDIGFRNGNEKPSFNDATAAYNPEWFEDNTLILLNLRQPCLPDTTDIKDISVVNGGTGSNILTINTLFIYGASDLSANTYIFIELKKSDIVGCTSVEVTYDKEDFFNISEFYLPQDTVRGLGEKFYEDDKFEYHYAYFSTDPIMSDTYVNYAYVREGFGDTESVSEALAKDHITLADLDKYDVEYIRIPKNNSNSTQVNYNLGGDTVLIWDSDIEIYQLFEHSSKMKASLYGNLSLFTDYNEFSQFIKIFEENIKCYHDVFNTWDESVPFEALISKYTEEWFDNNSLIIIHYSQGHYINGRNITIFMDKDASPDGGDIMTVNIDTLNFGPDLGVDWFLCVEFNKTDVEKCTEFRLIINELPSLSD